MDYEKKYKEALGWMKSLYGGLHGKTKEEAEKYFPELKESEDERTRKMCMRYLDREYQHCSFADDKKNIEKCIAWLEKQGQQKLASSAKNCKDDTLLDLLNKMPSCITVDGVDYHFVLKKTIAYMAFYEGEGEEGRDKIIFWMAGDPIDLLTAMLEKLKKEGLLE